MSNNSQEISEPNTRGAVTKLFGVILIILGALNTMLSWRGGFEVLSLPVIFLASGLALCLVGSILRHIRG